MWTSGLLKHNVRLVLQGHILYSILATAIRIVCILFVLNSLFFSKLFPLIWESDTLLKNGTYYTIICGSLFLVVLARILIFNPISVGCNRYFMEQRQGTPPFATIFSVFTERSYWNVVKQMFFRDLQIFLLAVLLIVPGIYRAYQLRLVPWILAENPALSKQHTFSLSAMLVKNEILSLLLLDLSFLGWFLLSCVTLGIGFLGLLPYYWATMAECYSAYRIKAFSLVEETRKHLTGFACYPSI